MLTLTALAAKKLKEAVQAQTTEPEVCIRLIPSPSEPNRLEMRLDKERQGDQVVESEGEKVLLLSPELGQVLDEMIIDCQETPQGIHFTISKLATDT
jgi:Fe-S cluster assembly iron-binding protein IscA